MTEGEYDSTPLVLGPIGSLLKNNCVIKQCKHLILTISVERHVRQSNRHFEKTQASKHLLNTLYHIPKILQK